MKSMFTLIGCAALFMTCTNCGSERSTNNSNLHPNGSQPTYVYTVTLDLPAGAWKDTPCELKYNPGKKVTFPITSFNQDREFSDRRIADSEASRLKNDLVRTCNGHVDFYCKKRDKNIQVNKANCRSAIINGLKVTKSLKR